MLPEWQRPRHQCRPPKRAHQPHRWTWSSRAAVPAADPQLLVLREAAQAAEAQTHELVVERIQLAHGRNVHEFVAKQHDVPLKRTLRGDQADDEAGNGLVAGVERIQPMLQRFKRMKVQGACWSLTRLQSLQR